MMRSFGLVALLVSARALAADAAAAPTAAPTKDKEAVTFNEVERGVYLGASAGPLFVVNPPAAAGTPRPFSTGQMAAVEVGVDVGDRLSLGLFFAGTANREGTDYVGTSGGTASGDFGMLVPGVSARFSLVGMNDSQGTTRTFIFLRAGAGYAFYSPAELLPDAHDVLVFAGGGVQYHTRLRHFSIGLELLGTFSLPSSTIGFAVTPSLRYAF